MEGKAESRMKLPAASCGELHFIEKKGVQITRPVRTTLAPEETKQIVVDRDRIASDVFTAEGEIMTYRFYRPPHRPDDDMGGRIVVDQ